MRKLAQQRIDYDAWTPTTVVNRLAGRGALERQADPADRRVKALVLTPEGERLRDQFWRNFVTDPDRSPHSAKAACAHLGTGSSPSSTNQQAEGVAVLAIPGLMRRPVTAPGGG